MKSKTGAPMKPEMKKRLEEKGWKVGTPREFLNLSDDEHAYVELKLTLSRNLQELRREKQLTQEDLAELRGKDVACWCPLPRPGEPDLCHAAVYLKLRMTDVDTMTFCW